MNHLKSLGLVAVAAMALMALAASSASATTLVGGEPEKTLGSGDTIDFSIPSGKSAVLVDTEGGELDTCSTSTIKAKLSSATTGSIEEWTWGSCTFPTKTITLGKLQFSGGTNTEGSVEADSEIGVTINTIFFGSCVYRIPTLKRIGTIFSAVGAIILGVVALKGSGSNLACPETAVWTGTYNATTANLHVEP